MTSHTRALPGGGLLLALVLAGGSPIARADDNEQVQSANRTATAVSRATADAANFCAQRALRGVPCTATPTHTPIPTATPSPSATPVPTDTPEPIPSATETAPCWAMDPATGEIVYNDDGTPLACQVGEPLQRDAPADEDLPALELPPEPTQAPTATAAPTPTPRPPELPAQPQIVYVYVPQPAPAAPPPEPTEVLPTRTATPTWTPWPTLTPTPTWTVVPTGTPSPTRVVDTLTPTPTALATPLAAQAPPPPPPAPPRPPEPRAPLPSPTGWDMALARLYSPGRKPRWTPEPALDPITAEGWASVP